VVSELRTQTAHKEYERARSHSSRPRVSTNQIVERYIHAIDKDATAFDLSETHQFHVNQLSKYRTLAVNLLDSTARQIVHCTRDLFLHLSVALVVLESLAERCV
jgi:hypothetical protein